MVCLCRCPLPRTWSSGCVELADRTGETAYLLRRELIDAVVGVAGSAAAPQLQAAGDA